MLALAVCAIVAACVSSGGGGDCFPSDHGPSEPSCAAFDLGLTCPVGTAWFSCVCEQVAAADAGTAQQWVCAPVGTTGNGGSAGTGGAAGADAGDDATTLDAGA
jgi:hypothetical protein